MTECITLTALSNSRYFTSMKTEGKELLFKIISVRLHLGAYIYITKDLSLSQAIDQSEKRQAAEPTGTETQVRGASALAICARR